MADTLGQSSDRSTSTTRNVSAALGVLVLALAPQLVELLWSFATIFGVSGRGTLQVLTAHGAALLLAVRGQNLQRTAPANAEDCRKGPQQFDQLRCKRKDKNP